MRNHILSCMIGLIACLMTGCVNNREVDRTNIQTIAPSQIFGSGFKQNLSQAFYPQPIVLASDAWWKSDYILVPIECPYPASKNTATLETLLPVASVVDDIEYISSQPLINFAVFNRATGESVLALDRPAIVWEILKVKVNPEELFLLITDVDTNGDKELDGRDATSLHRLNLKNKALTRLTPPNSTVIAASLEAPRAAWNADEQVSLFKDPAHRALLITVGATTKSKGRLAQDEPHQTIYIHLAPGLSPKAMLNDLMWNKADQIWSRE